jgi:hypothetical protein
MKASTSGGMFTEPYPVAGSLRRGRGRFKTCLIIMVGSPSAVSSTIFSWLKWAARTTFAGPGPLGSSLVEFLEGVIVDRDNDDGRSGRLHTPEEETGIKRFELQRVEEAEEIGGSHAGPQGQPP